ncbi:hypothetical protein PVK06_014052 [Gossypium arboreum]|uniref:Uncharacterized protein n=1 Tax=Gossypium arboreum TaxID=29729 RepID=A0ABR0PUA8_GOSAR|nr:hypothetical protein PVK06_014052 [Gossypium arboreum]
MGKGLDKSWGRPTWEGLGPAFGTFSLNGNLILFWPGWYAADDCEWMEFSHLVLWGYHHHTPNTEMLKSDFKASKQAQNTDLCDGFSSATCLRSINFYNEEWRRGALKMKEGAVPVVLVSDHLFDLIATDVLEIPGQMLVLHVSCMYLIECTIMKKKKKKLQFFCLAAFMECPRMLLNAMEEDICKEYEDSGSHSI